MSSISSPGSNSSSSSVSENFVDIPLQSKITKVQPMTGIVLWADSYNGTALKADDQYIQLEYAYVRPSDVVIGDNLYDWSAVENLLEQIRGRGKQAILRWYYVYPGRATAVPNYIKNYPDYHETTALSEGLSTGFPDWSHPELQQATLDFYTAFAARYDHDPRIAFLQVGFGLWGEYHIYDPQVILGNNFPSKAYQKTFLQHLAAQFHELHWSISIDAGDSDNTPIANDASLLALHFGNFDDSFMHKEHAGYNKDMWTVFGYTQRYKHSPHGGELSYYSDFDQKNALNVAGMYGRNYETLSREFYITYMIGNDQPAYQSNERIKQAGMANGYKFHITEFKSSSSRSRITVINRGIAPIYYDAYIAINGIRAQQSLNGLLPNESLTVEVNSGGVQPILTIESDRLVAGQTIQFEADL
ncbi:MAG TPA: hypothetical protein VLC79_09390 [Cellvibrio sp.]|nr:hypothetical protein [Cellvibrio sp.]